MMRFGGRRRRALAVNAEISITNLVDVAFVLLIIFMITAPILQGGIEVQLPQAEARPINTPDAVVVSVAEDGGLFIEKTRVTDDEFEDVLRAHIGDAQDAIVTVKGDRAVDYGRMTTVLGYLNRMQVNIALAVEPQPRR
ncbi:MAG TPA: biopolymer transporter ExbD [Longimicrobiales bacterium]|nr:biopolymer transporter ExbD [Longimicrobiales bacterium]